MTAAHAVLRYSDDQPRDEHGRWAPGSASAQEKAAVRAYTGGDYIPIGAQLRGQEPHDGKHAATIAALDQVTLGSTTEAPTTVYRGISAGSLAALGGVGKGSLLRDPSFASATSSEAIAKDGRGFAMSKEGGAVMRISVPAGSHVADISALSTLRGEHEMLIARGASLRVTGWAARSRMLSAELVH